MVLIRKMKGVLPHPLPPFQTPLQPTPTSMTLMWTLTHPFDMNPRHHVDSPTSISPTFFTPLWRGHLWLISLQKNALMRVYNIYEPIINRRGDVNYMIFFLITHKKQFNKEKDFFWESSFADERLDRVWYWEKRKWRQKFLSIAKCLYVPPAESLVSKESREQHKKVKHPEMSLSARKNKERGGKKVISFDEITADSLSDMYVCLILCLFFLCWTLLYIWFLQVGGSSYCISSDLFRGRKS